MTRAPALALALAACAPSTAPPPRSAPAAPAEATALHLSGELPATPSGIGAPGSIVESLYDVCLDDGGRVARVTPAPGLAAADEAIVKALGRWSWFVVARAPRPCWRQRVLLGVPAASRLVRQAAVDVRGHALARATATPPAALSALYAGRVVDGAYKVCLGDDERVQSVRPMSGIAGGDDWATATLRATAWEVVAGPLARAPYCFAASVRLDLSATPARGAAPSLPPPSARPREPGVSIVVLR